MPWAHVAIPLAMATVGGGAALATVVLPDKVAAAPAHTWIDSPQEGDTFVPGTVHVDAHATDDDPITALELYVDGKLVDRDAKVRRTYKLVYGRFDWDAPKGGHTLVVRQVGGSGTESDSLYLVVGAAGATEVADGPAPTTTAPSGTSTSSSSTTTTTGPEEPTTTSSSTTTIPGFDPPETTVPPEGDDTTPDTVVPTTRPPVTLVIDSAALDGGDHRLYVGDCTYSVVVSARIRNADHAQVMVEGTQFNEGMSQEGPSTWSIRLPSGLWQASEVGSHRVVVVAGGAGQSATKVAGTVDIRLNCPKD